MSLDLSQLGSKLKKYREQFEQTVDEVSVGTGIQVSKLLSYENGASKPSGDDILILADYYKCDYNFFISNERTAAFEQTDTLFRRYGNQFGKKDRWVVQEFLYLCECEAFLIREMEKSNPQRKAAFSFKKQGNYFKGHAEGAAAELRKYLGYSSNEVGLDIYKEFRSIGCHVFRRKLDNSNISGLYVKHPTAGGCVLVNYDEDIYRQRFTAAHEAGHAILDSDASDVVVSFRDKKDLVEIRANTFASNFLMPSEALKNIPFSSQWDDQKIITWANNLKVSVEALSIALSQHGLISTQQANLFARNVKVPRDMKSDPELPDNLPPKIAERKKELLQTGLSSHYVDLCFNSYEAGILSAARLAEVLLSHQHQIADIAKLYGKQISYGD